MCTPFYQVDISFINNPYNTLITGVYPTSGITASLQIFYDYFAHTVTNRQPSKGYERRILPSSSTKIINPYRSSKYFSRNLSFIINFFQNDSNTGTKENT